MGNVISKIMCLLMGSLKDFFYNNYLACIQYYNINHLVIILCSMQYLYECASSIFIAKYNFLRIGKIEKLFARNARLLSTLKN